MTGAWGARWDVEAVPQVGAPYVQTSQSYQAAPSLTARPASFCSCSDLDDTDLESEGESGDEGRLQHHSDDESLPDLEPNMGSSFQDVDTGTEFGMDVSQCAFWASCAWQPGCCLGGCPVRALFRACREQLFEAVNLYCAAWPGSSYPFSKPQSTSGFAV